MTFETLLFQVDASLARITLNRPEAANSMNLQMAQDLMHAMLRCDQDPEVRAVLITGSGGTFSAGGDLQSFSGAKDRLGPFLRELSTYLHATISRMARMDAPVVAAVNGAAAGGGMSLACAADLVLAAESARFVIAYSQVGLSPDLGSTYVLPRLIGLRRTQELLLTDRRLSAAEAHAWGLVTRVVPDAELEAESEKLARSLAAGPTRAFAEVKRLLLTTYGEGLESQMERESVAISGTARTDDAQEAIQAFLAKRRPKFSGR
jgi:2-(1,2-epoxy-1,2-dihydrophenyl)acetyl-CoA isomerase